MFQTWTADSTICCVSRTTLATSSGNNRRALVVHYGAPPSPHDAFQHIDILVVNLPSTGDSASCITSHAGEKQAVYPDYSWNAAPLTRADYERRYPCMPTRILDNLVAPHACVSVAPRHRVQDPANLGFLIEATFSDRTRCVYDFSTPMRRRNARQ